MLAPLLALALTAAPAHAPAKGLPFIDDDYPRALALARARHVPLFADVWAPWCHTCLFMRAYVLTSPALSPESKEFVWLSVNSEQAKNAPFLARYPIEAWPTLMVIDPQREKPVLTWLGSATAPELVGMLGDAARSLEPGHSGNAALVTLARADAEESAGHHAASAALYAQALAEGGKTWSQRPRVLQSQDFALMSAGDLEGCAALAEQAAPALPPGTAFANLVGTGLGCVDAMKPSPARDAHAQKLVPLCESAVKLPGLLADDRSGLYETLVDVVAEPQKKVLAGAWLDALEDAARRAHTPAERSAFDPHRVEAAIALGDPARALPALRQSERDLPGDYNAFAREALVELALNQPAKALLANDAALKRAYGPRTLRLLENRAEIFERLHRPADARTALEQALDAAKKLPDGQRLPHAVASLQKSIAALDAAH